MREGLAAHRVIGMTVGLGVFLGLLAEVYGKRGQTEEGLKVLAEALAEVHTARAYEADLYRLKGELLLQSKAGGPESEIPKEAEECFHQAIAIARRQSAKSWELRAATGLARLWQQQDKKKEAHEMLADIYNWFTEGFDTKDLQEAKALLDELS
jgi:predicted ATPase